MRRIASGAAYPYSRSGWVLIESLLSLIFFSLILTLLNQQSENDFRHIKAIDEQADQGYRAKQSLMIRRLLQDFAWLEGGKATAEKAACSSCAEAQLEVWFLGWIGDEGVTLPSTSDALGERE